MKLTFEFRFCSDQCFEELLAELPEKYPRHEVELHVRHGGSMHAKHSSKCIERRVARGSVPKDKPETDGGGLFKL